LFIFQTGSQSNSNREKAAVAEYRIEIRKEKQQPKTPKKEKLIVYLFNAYLH
jgi:hypothetical protein